jgi:hypothetical protein
MKLLSFGKYLDIAMTANESETSPMTTTIQQVNHGGFHLGFHSEDALEKGWHVVAASQSKTCVGVIGVCV